MRRAVSRDDRDPEGTWFEEATLSGSGLRIEGQSTWPDEDPSEYGFAVDVAAERLPALLAALGAPADADVLDALVARYASGRRGLTQLMDDAGIDYGSWSRVGD